MKKYPPLDPIEPTKPERSYYKNFGSKNDKVIYHDVEQVGDSDIDLEEYFNDQDEELPKPALRYNEITLQDILDLAPKGVKPSDISLNISYPRYVEYLEIMFLYKERDLDLEEAVYQKDIKKYNKDYAKFQKEMAEYEVNLAAYQESQREEKIKELEDQLSKLKK